MFQSVIMIVKNKVTRQCPQTTTFEEKGEPNRIPTEVPLLTSLTPLPLGQTGSHRRRLNFLYLKTPD